MLIEPSCAEVFVSSVHSLVFRIFSQFFVWLLTTIFVDAIEIEKKNRKKPLPFSVQNGAILGGGRIFIIVIIAHEDVQNDIPQLVKELIMSQKLRQMF